MQTKLTATELMARPTYVEEFQNIRDNVNKAVMNTTSVAPKQNEDECDNISHYSKMSVRRSNAGDPIRAPQSTQVLPSFKHLDPFA